MKQGQKIWCMGKQMEYPEFKKQFKKLLWMTYRKNFAPLLIEKPKVANLTSDAGWGCVIRCT